MKRLSENLEALSQRARRIEDAVAAARSEAQDKLDERREQLRVDAGRAIEKVEAAIASAPEQAAEELAALKSKIDADKERIKAQLEELPRQVKPQEAEGRAEDLELHAAVSVDYAIATIAQAELAILDAVAARREAEEAKLEPHPMTTQ